MKRTHLRIGALGATALVVAGLASVALPTALQAQGPVQSRATATVYSGGVDFQPNVDFSRAVLTVSGDGKVFVQVFEPGDRLSIGMFDPEGQPLAHGTYTWSLELMPDATTARELRIAATRNGGQAPEPWTPQTGSFAIRGGILADPDAGEAQQRVAAQPPSGLSSAMTPSAFGSSRGAAEDDDAAVGSRAGLEAEARAAAEQRAPVAATGALLQANREASDDADATTRAFGQSLEPSAATSNNNQFSPQSRSYVPRPRSDGSNGRPRS